MPRIYRPVVCATLLSSFTAALAGAAEIRGDTFFVHRTAAAASCPDETALQQEVQRLTPRERVERHTPLRIDVTLDRQGRHFVARLQVSGRQQGARVLRAAAPDCDALSQPLVVALAILLDLEVPTTPPAATTESAPTPKRASPPPAPDANSPAAPHDSISGGLLAGAAATLSHPHGFSALGRAGGWLQGSSWAIGLGGLLVVPRSIAFEPGEVEVGLFGGELWACPWRWQLPGALDLWPCGVAQAGQLYGEGHGYNATRRQRRPWVALGVEARLGGRISEALGWTLGAGLLAPLNREEFHVDGLSGSAFESTPIGGRLGLDLEVRIW